MHLLHFDICLAPQCPYNLSKSRELAGDGYCVLLCMLKTPVQLRPLNILENLGLLRY